MMLKNIALSPVSDKITDFIRAQSGLPLPALTTERVCNETTTRFLLNRVFRSDGTLRVK